MFFILFAMMIFKLCIVSTLHDGRVYKLNKKIQTILIGDSHAQYGFNDKIIPRSLNLSNRSEKFIWTYLKIQKFLNFNKQVNHIVLSVSYHSFMKTNDTEIFGDERSFFYSRYGFLFGNEDYLNILNENKFNKDLLLNFLKYNLGVPIEGHREIRRRILDLLFKNRGKEEFFGHFLEDKENVLTSERLKRTVDRHFMIKGHSYLQVLYFQKIIRLVRSKGVRLTLLTLPVHADYLRDVPLRELQYLNRLAFENKDTGVNYINLSHLKVKDSHFKDFDHLNGIGAAYIAVNFLKEL